MKSKLAILIPLLLVVVYIVYFFSPKTKTTSTDLSSLENPKITAVFNAANYIINSQGSPKYDAKVVYKGKAPAFVSNGSEYTIQGQTAKSVNIAIPQNKKVDIKLTSTTGNFNLLLRETLVSDLRVNSQAGNVYIELPSKTSSQMSITLVAGNLEIGVPDDIDGIRITPAEGTTLNFSTENYEEVDGAYQSKNYDKARIKADLNLNAGTAKLLIKKL